MSMFDNDIYYYPLIVHPLAVERKDVKNSYFSLLQHFCKTLNAQDVLNSVRFGRYKKDYFAENDYLSCDYKKVAKQILGTHFVPFKFFTYRFVFVFDCIYLFAYDDYERAKAICIEARKYINRRYHKRLDDLVDDLFSGKQISGQYPLISEDMLVAWSSLQVHRSTLDKKVIFTATMSAGKSTLINAIFGKDFAFTKKAACTSTVVGYIPMPIYHQNYLICRTDADRMDCPAADVRNYLEAQHSSANLIGYCASILSKTKLSIYDSPGINSSQHPEHKTITREALSNMQYDCVVYVISVENYGSSDDYTHLKYILQHASYKKIIFVVNMLDTCDDEDDDIEAIIFDIRKHLSDIGFSNPAVCPISAKAGLLFKQKLLGQELTQNAEKTRIELQSKFNAQFFDLSCFYPNFLVNDLSIANTPNFLPGTEEFDKTNLITAYLHSGLPQFERMLSEKIMEA